MAANSFFWHDYETFGTDPRKDRPVQFAGVRTDEQFNIIDEPLVVYCQSSDDYLPQPEACLITGITPQQADTKGVCEAAFIHLIHQQLSQPNTCTLGYNNIRFDDEVTRNALYRNFYDPYIREWQNGNSRWDLLDVVRAAKALRPEGIEWPMGADEKPSFRLDQLTVANGIAHESAHDALSDVYATIAFAKRISQVQPRLYQFLLQHRSKHHALELLSLGSFKPVVHVSGKYPALKHCLAIVLPICKHPINSNGVIVYDLSVDPQPMLHLSVAEIQQRLFIATDDLPEGVARIPLKTVHINKCPVLAPISVIRPEDEQRLQIDLSICVANIAKIKSVIGLNEKLAAVFALPDSREQETDADLAIYSGGFFSESDKQKMHKLRTLTPEQLAKTTFCFEDSRLPDMLFRYRARNYPDSLSQTEKQQWQAFCRDRLTGKRTGASITFSDYFAKLKQLQQVGTGDPDILSALQHYGYEKMQRLGVTLD